MNVSELKQRLAQAEKLIAEIKADMAAKPSDDKSLPSRVEDANFTIDWDGQVLGLHSNADRKRAIACGNAFRTREQAEAWAHVRSVLGRIRQMPGQVDPSKGARHCIQVRAERSNGKTVTVFEVIHGEIFLNGYMFPAFANHAYAQHAVDTIGPDNLIRCAATMAGVEIDHAQQ